MTNVQKAYDAVYRDGKSAASFNLIFPSLGVFSYRFDTINQNGGLKGITWFKGKRTQLQDWDGQRFLGPPRDYFKLFGAAKQPNQRKFRYYQFAPYNWFGRDSEIHHLEDVTWGEWFGDY